MTILKWKKGEPAPEGDYKGHESPQPAKIMVLAEELAGEMDGKLLAVYTLDANQTAIVVRLEVGGLNQVVVPSGAQSLDDFPDEADHFCSGAELAGTLKGMKFTSPKSKQMLMNALSTYDQMVTSQLAKYWMRYHLDEFKDRLAAEE